MDHILRKFPHDPVPPYVERADGLTIHLKDGRSILDATAGVTACVSLGYGHPKVLAAMRAQMEKFCYSNYNIWSNEQLDELADLLASQAPPGVDQVYFSGNSGSEAIEAALKLSYQVHYDQGKRGKTHFISREQSFHGATLQCLAVTGIDIYEFYGPILPPHRVKIPRHHPYYFKRDDETLEEYARRSAADLEQKILEVGPENVCAFVGETMLGSIVGNLPPAPGYWQEVRAICDRYDVHLILDEIYCGLGRTGKVYCCSWDDVSPDFLCVGKNLAAGYVPLSAVLTRPEYGEIMAAGQGRIQHGHTHQGHALGVAAALAVQRETHSPEMLDHVQTLGEHLRGRITAELGDHPFFRNVRGRGLLNSFEYDCADRNAFSVQLEKTMLEEHSILINAKWHRSSFTPANTITREQLDHVLDCYFEVFRGVAARY